MREFLYTAAVMAITAALIPWPHLFPLWVAVILLVFFCTLPPSPTRGKGSS